ncbi:MAG: hypothetical protein ACFE0R_05690 [Salinarimonas sp.]
MQHGYGPGRPIDPEAATRSVLRTPAEHVPYGRLEKLRRAMVEEVGSIGPLDHAA